MVSVFVSMFLLLDYNIKVMFKRFRNIINVDIIE